MMQSSYLSHSRHGVYYFRWPIPPSSEQKRTSVRISLRTRCPHRASDLARFLASCGRLIPDQENVPRLRQDQIRSMVHRYFKASLDKYSERLNDKGFFEKAVSAMQQECSVWFLNIMDEGDDDNKRIKSTAARRKVPVHPDLIGLGFLEFVDRRWNGTRLFPDYNYNANGGYGRTLGRWCNESFLPKLGLKEPALVFHCLRHTVVTRLSQADVPEPIVQCIVGNARSGVKQEVYNREGYMLAQLKEAIDRITIDKAN